MKISVLFIFLFYYNLAFTQLQLLNDEFDNSSSLVNWNDINQTEGWNIQQLEWHNINDSTEGHFQMAPHTSGWYNEWKGALMYKDITGDFVLTTEVLALGRDKVSVPDTLYSLAGIMVRSPTTNTSGQAGWSADQQNYIFLAVGTANGNCNGPCTGQFEVKSTVNSNSQLNISNITTTHVQLRFARMGGHFIILYRLMPSGNWIVHRRYNREDFPETLQVGFTTYTDWSKVSAVGPTFHNQNVIVSGVPNDPAPDQNIDPDLIADFNFYRLDSLYCPAQLSCNTPATLSNADMLSFLSSPSVSHCPEYFHINQPTIDISYVHTTADTITYSSTLLDNSHIILHSNETSLELESSISSGAILEILSDGCP